MNKKLLDILACPLDKTHPLELYQCNTKGDVIVEGALYCVKCMRFFPIIEEIPIMLPDDLRDKNHEIEFLGKNKEKLPEKIIKQGQPWHL